jgi:hypothetical protein
VREESWLLVNGRNAGSSSGVRIELLYESPAEMEFAAVRAQNPRGNLGEGRFSGAVFTKERMHLAASQFERGTPKRSHCFKVLHDSSSA